MAYLFMRESSRRAEHPLPAAWRDSLRESFVFPAALARLASEPSGDAPIFPDVRDLVTTAEPVRDDRYVALRRLSGGIPAQAGDAATIMATLHDATLDRVVAASRARTYDARARLLPALGRSGLFPPLGDGPLFQGSGISRGPGELVLRGEASLRRGDVRRARADFLAALAVGRMISRTEVTNADLHLGWQVMGDAAQGLARLAARTRDVGLAADAREVYDWTRRRVRYGFLTLEPDTMVSLAADTLLPRGMRVGALVGACVASIMAHPLRIVLGPERSIRDGAHALRNDRDPVVARAAVIADSTLAELKALGPFGRIRLVSRPARR